MRSTFLRLAALFSLVASLGATETARVPLADGFEIPVGRNGQSYYMARGVRANGHLGEDWNGTGGGDTDLGDPIYSTADGIVVFAQNYRMGWGNVVITRHAYLENGEVKYVDALYGHLLDFSVRLGQFVRRGQQIGRMGNNNGMYDAHLHFEMRKNLNVGMHRNSFPRDWSVYWSPKDFIAERTKLPGSGRIVSVPVNTFSETPPPLLAGDRHYTPAVPPTRAGTAVVDGNLVSRDGKVPLPMNIYSGRDAAQPQRKQTPIRRPEYRVNRFDDMRSLGYE